MRKTDIKRYFGNLKRLRRPRTSQSEGSPQSPLDGPAPTGLHVSDTDEREHMRYKAPTPFEVFPEEQAAYDDACADPTFFMDLHTFVLLWREYNSGEATLSAEVASQPDSIAENATVREDLDRSVYEILEEAGSSPASPLFRKSLHPASPSSPTNFRRAKDMHRRTTIYDKYMIEVDRSVSTNYDEAMVDSNRPTTAGSDTLPYDPFNNQEIHQMDGSRVATSTAPSLSSGSRASTGFTLDSPSNERRGFVPGSDGVSLYEYGSDRSSDDGSSITSQEREEAGLPSVSKSQKDQKAQVKLLEKHKVKRGILIPARSFSTVSDD
jgi:hypothetical protein